MTVPRFIGLIVVLIGILAGATLVALPFVAALHANRLVTGFLFVGSSQKTENKAR